MSCFLAVKCTPNMRTFLQTCAFDVLLSCCEVFAMLLDLSCAFEMFLSLPFGISFEDSCLDVLKYCKI